MHHLLEQTAELIQQDFQLVEPPPTVDRDHLLAFLEEVVDHLLERNLERLFNILYRLDVDEAKTHRALSPSSPERPARALALLIWEREAQKVQSRAQYQTADDEEDEDITRW